MKTNLKNFTNTELFAEAKIGVKKETESTLYVLHVLREIEHRRAFAEKSFPSLLEFCVDYLGYKKGAAYRNKHNCKVRLRKIRDMYQLKLNGPFYKSKA